MLVGIHVLEIMIVTNEENGRENSDNAYEMYDEIYLSKFQPIVFLR